MENWIPLSRIFPFAVIISLCMATVQHNVIHDPGDGYKGVHLLSLQKLMPGEYLSNGDNGYLIMLGNGNLVVCAALSNKNTTCDWNNILWETHTAGNEGAYAVMEHFGCLSVYPNPTNSQKLGADVRLWQSHTMAKAGCVNADENCSFIEMTPLGDCVMHKGNNPLKPGNTIWQTNTNLPPKNMKNVVYIIVDDLRPEFAVAYKQKRAITPSFDRLAKEGLVFTRAYCQIAVCAPSRSSFMSGLRPDIISIFNFNNHIREPDQPSIITTPEQFTKAGINTLGGGKTFHINLPPDWDTRKSWTTEIQPYYPFWEYRHSSDFAECPNKASACAINGSLDQIYDYRLASHTIQTIRTVHSLGKPFFVMAGFRRPHRDFLVHSKYWNMYDEKNINTAIHNHRDPSQPEMAFHHAGVTLPNGTTVPGNADQTWPVDIQKWFIKGYLSAVTQTDAQVGRILDVLDELELTDNTLVVLHADHGWQLGEHGLWDKQTEFELATRVPLIIRAPWKKNSVGQRTDSFTELVDMHPTVASLSGLPPSLPTHIDPSIRLEQAVGIDLSPLFDNPKASLKNASFSQFPNCGEVGQECMACTGPKSWRNQIKAMGYSIRTDQWRYTVYLPFNTTYFVGDFSKTPLASELYDHRGNASVVYDFDADGECKNVISDPQFNNVVQDLHSKLQKQYSYPDAWLKSRHAFMVQHEKTFCVQQGWASCQNQL